MIKFFRKIRQQLLTENKFSKYLLYAVGEIVLVIIGILFALQINNWNNEKNDIKDLKDNFTFLIEDLEKDKIQLTKLKEDRLLRASQCSEFIESYVFAKPIVSENPLDNFRAIISEAKFENNQSGFTKVKSSKIFESAAISEIRKKIGEYNEAVEFIRFQEYNQNAHTEAMEKELWINGFWNQIYPTMRANSFYKGKFEMPPNKIDFQKLISSSEPVKAIFSRYEVVMPWITTLYDDLIIKGEEIKLEIDKYLENE